MCAVVNGSESARRRAGVPREAAVFLAIDELIERDRAGEKQRKRAASGVVIHQIYGRSLSPYDRLKHFASVLQGRQTESRRVAAADRSPAIREPGG